MLGADVVVLQIACFRLSRRDRVTTALTEILEHHEIISPNRRQRPGR